MLGRRYLLTFSSSNVELKNILYRSSGTQKGFKNEGYIGHRVSFGRCTCMSTRVRTSHTVGWFVLLAGWGPVWAYAR